MEIEQIMGLCRLCLANEQVINPIFDNESGCNQVFERINACLPINVSKNDKLPKSICNICWNKLDLLYEFRKVSVDAEVTLLSWVEQAEMREQKFVIEEYVNLEEIDIKPEPVEKYYVDSTLLDKIIDDSESLHEEFTIKHEFDEPAPAKRPRLSDTGESMEQIVINQQSEAFIPAKDMEQTIHIKTEIGDISENEEKQDGDSSVSKVGSKMPKYKGRVKQRVNLDENKMKHGILCVEEKEISAREEAVRYDMLRSTLQDRFKTPIYNSDQGFEFKQQLYNHIKDLDDCLMPLTKTEFLKLAFHFAEHLNIPHRFNKEKKMAGAKFFNSFLRKYPDMVPRTPYSTSQSQIMPRRKISVEEAKLKKKEYDRKRRQKVKSDPVSFEILRYKERLKYLRKEEKGQVKPICVIGPRERWQKEKTGRKIAKHIEKKTAKVHRNLTTSY